MINHVLKDSDPNLLDLQEKELRVTCPGSEALEVADMMFSVPWWYLQVEKYQAGC